MKCVPSERPYTLPPGSLASSEHLNIQRYAHREAEGKAGRGLYGGCGVGWRNEEARKTEKYEIAGRKKPGGAVLTWPAPWLGRTGTNFGCVFFNEIKKRHGTGRCHSGFCRFYLKNYWDEQYPERGRHKIERKGRGRRNNFVPSEQNGMQTLG